MKYLLCFRSNGRCIQREFTTDSDLYKYLCRYIGAPKDYWINDKNRCTNAKNYYIECEDKNAFINIVSLYVLEELL